MPPQPAASRSSLESASVFALFATIVLAVLVVIPSGSASFVPVKSFLLAGGALATLALFILARLARGNLILPPLLLVGALWLPALAYALSSVFSGSPFSVSLWGASFSPDTLAFMLTASALGTLAALIVRRTQQFRSFFIVVGATLGALAAIQLFIILIGQFAPSALSPALSVAGSYGDLAALMGLAVIGSLLSLRFLEVSPRARALLYALGAAALALLAIAGSSFVWTLVALSALGLFIESVMRRRGSVVDFELEDGTLVEEEIVEERGARSLVLPLAVLAVALFFLVGGTLGNALANALHVNVLSVRPSWQSTLSVGRAVYASDPLFGSGPGTFGVEWLRHRDPSLNSTVFWNVDFTSGIGFLPTSAATTGFVGLAAWVLLLGTLLLVGIRTLIRPVPEYPAARAAMLLSFTASVYLFAVALFDSPGVVVLALAFIALGVFASAARYGAPSGQWGIAFARSPRAGFVIVFGLTLLLLASVVAAYALVGRAAAAGNLAQANAALAARNPAAAAAAAARSLAFAPTSAAYQAEAAAANAELALIAASSTLPAADAQKAFQAALAGGVNAALTATRLDPNDYRAWLALGTLYAQAVPLRVSGAYASAKAAYDRAAALNPTAPQVPYIIAQLDIANKDLKSAEADLQRAISLKQDYTAAIFLLSQLYVQDGNVKDALASAEAAAYFAPNDPNVLFQVGVLSAASKDLPRAANALSSAVAANPQFANARYFLAAVYAKQGDYANARAQLEALASLSADNARAVAPQLAALKNGTDPFPANLLAAPAAPARQ